MKYLGLLLMLVPLAACSYTSYLTDTNDKGGTVNMVTELNKDSAVEKANDYCHQFSKVARVTQTDPQSNTLRFACERGR